jgi:hypothetical protein
MNIQYINWNGERKTWNTDIERYFVLFDRKLVSTDGSYLDHSAGFYGQTVADVRHNITEFLVKNPNFVADWREANARIVKAPCAFDARQIHILVEVL